MLLKLWLGSSRKWRNYENWKREQLYTARYRICQVINIKIINKGFEWLCDISNKLLNNLIKLKRYRFSSPENASDLPACTSTWFVIMHCHCCNKSNLVCWSQGSRNGSLGHGKPQDSGTSCNEVIQQASKIQFCGELTPCLTRSHLS